MHAISNHSVTPPVIEMTHVAVSSPRTDQLILVRDINWKVCAGEFWVIVSSPGGGKSACLLTAAAIQPPCQGEIQLFGESIRELREVQLMPLRRRLSLVFEYGGRLFAGRTIFENITLPYRYHHNCSPEEMGDIAEPLLEMLGLSDYALRLPAQVPRGLLARVGLCRALIMRPEVLLVDNPLHGLDARQQDWWMAFLQKANRESLPGWDAPLTIVAAVDDGRPWLQHANRFALIQKQDWRNIGNRDAALTAGLDVWSESSGL